MKLNKTAALTALVCMLLCILPPSFAEGEVIYISDADGLLEFSKSCTLDTWSRGKSVELGADIDLAGKDFIPIPSFGGSFDGGGHTVSGIDFSKSGSVTGFFRYVESGASVTGLNISASFMPGGSKSSVGGVVGENSGLIADCTFSGTVSGENVIGGIAGENMQSGRIISCTASGAVSGENYTGGIAGRNKGLISDCENNAEVNTVYKEKKTDLTDIDPDTGALIETYMNEKEQNEEESVLGHTDTGGITGYSSGIVQGCINNAAVGYKHIGYNVGGIAGRQSGYILGCVNNGLVRGRKDVGGITGQVEPYIILNASQSTISNIQSEIDGLHSMVDGYIKDGSSMNEDAKRYLENISSGTKTARDSAQILMDKGTGYVDEGIGKVNAEIALLSDTGDKIVPVLATLEEASGSMSDSFNEMIDTIDRMDIKTPRIGTDENDGNGSDLRTELDKISKAEKFASKAADSAQDAIDDLDSAVYFRNREKTRTAAEDLAEDLRQVIWARRVIKSSVGMIRQILSQHPGMPETAGTDARAVLDQLAVIEDNIGNTIEYLSLAEDNIGTLLLNAEIDFEALKNMSGNIQDSMSLMERSLSELSGNLDSLSDAVKNDTNEYFEELDGDINAAKEDFSNSARDMSLSVDKMRGAFSELNRIFKDFASADTLQLTGVDDEFRSANRDLFSSLSGISGDISALRDEAEERLDGAGAKGNELNDRFNKIMNLVVDEVDGIRNNEYSSLSDVFTDVSDDEIENVKQGKAESCTNSGTVEADRNVGGIAGAMAIEYSKDPEDDIPRPDTLHFTYSTEAVLQKCVNEGDISGKKDCTGGVAGLAEIGTVYGCENYGNIESDGGSYVGGIAGRSDSSVRKCYSKGSLKGERYVGGIAGKAKAMSGCFSISVQEGDESIGAVCGTADDRSRISGNYFLDKGTGGIDGISYSGCAEPADYDMFVTVEGIPQRFISFRVSFYADGELVDGLDCEYGSSTDDITYPQIPERDGYFGVWDKPDSGTVTQDIRIYCEYKPYITILASEERNKSKKLAIALAEGQFTDEARLHARLSDEAPPLKSDDDTVVYSVQLENTDIGDGEPVTLRFINEKKRNVSAWRADGAGWKKIKVTKRGKYVILDTVGANSVICLHYGKGTAFWAWLAAVILIMAAAFALLKLRPSVFDAVRKRIKRPSIWKRR